METYTLEYVRRTPQGTRAARRLRREGMLPGVLYGHRKDVVPLAVKADQFEAFLRSGQRMVTLQDGPVSEMALVKEVQHDALGTDIVHVDFARVDPDERVEVTVPVELHGEAKGAKEGGMVDQVLHELKIECRALAIPETFRVDVTELEIEQSLHVRDIEPPEGVKLLDDPDSVIVVVHPPRAAETPEEEAEAGEETAEPEVIGREAEETEEDEESSS